MTSVTSFTTNIFRESRRERYCEKNPAAKAKTVRAKAPRKPSQKLFYSRTRSLPGLRRRSSQNVQNTPASDHFWKLRCRKSARRCGAKHISKSKCTKHTSVGPLLEVAMSKKCTPLWHEARFEVKMLKTLGVRTAFGSSDLEKVHAVVARSTFGSQTVKSTRGSDHFWKFRSRKSARHCGAKHIWKSKC